LAATWLFGWAFVKDAVKVFCGVTYAFDTVYGDGVGVGLMPKPSLFMLSM